MPNPTFGLPGTTHHFSPLGGPLDQTPLPALISELGYALTAWARMEYMLTHLVIHINKEEANAALYEKDPSSRFSGLIRLLRKWLTRHPNFDTMRLPNDAAFFDHLLALAEIRNEWVHGFLDSIDPDTNGFTMRVMQRTSPNVWAAKTISYFPDAPTELASQANFVLKHFVALAEVLFDQAPDEPN